MKYYLAYGSNLNKEQMARRCPGAVPIGTATIHNCRLEFRRGVLTIEPDDSESVPVGVWEITAADEKALDRYEGYPRFYYKKNIRVLCHNGPVVNAMAYIMTEGYPIEAPGDGYFYTVMRGYHDFELADKTQLMAAYERAKWGAEVE